MKKHYIILLITVVLMLASCDILVDSINLFDHSAVISIRNDFGKPIQVSVNGKQRELDYEIGVNTYSLWTVKWDGDRITSVEIQAEGQGSTGRPLTSTIMIWVADEERRAFVINQSRGSLVIE